MGVGELVPIQLIITHNMTKWLQRSEHCQSGNEVVLTASVSEPNIM